MASYLERVVMSGARTAPTARPPVAAAPPLPALGRAMITAFWPASHDPGLGGSRPPQSDVAGRQEVSSLAQSPDPTRNQPTTPASRPGADGGAIIRAPRGLRLDAAAPGRGTARDLPAPGEAGDRGGPVPISSAPPNTMPSHGEAAS
jgi:hypothetical protein